MGTGKEEGNQQMGCSRSQVEEEGVVRSKDLKTKHESWTWGVGQSLGGPERGHFSGATKTRVSAVGREVIWV